MTNAVWFVLGGMAITFATLGVLQLVMTVLSRLLRPTPNASAGGRAPSSPRR